MADRYQFIKELLADHRIGVLATTGPGHPHQSLMAYAASPDLSRIVIVTPRATRKYANLTDDRAVSFLVDSRKNTAADLAEAVAVTAYGRCAPVEDGDCDELISLYLEKHPAMEDFVHSPTTSVLMIEVERYDVVERFQNVTQVYPEGSE